MSCQDVHAVRRGRSGLTGLKRFSTGPQGLGEFECLVVVAQSGLQWILESREEKALGKTRRGKFRMLGCCCGYPERRMMKVAVVSQRRRSGRIRSGSGVGYRGGICGSAAAAVATWELTPLLPQIGEGRVRAGVGAGGFPGGSKERDEQSGRWGQSAGTWTVVQVLCNVDVAHLLRLLVVGANSQPGNVCARPLV